MRSNTAVTKLTCCLDPLPSHFIVCLSVFLFLKPLLSWSTLCIGLKSKLLKVDIKCHVFLVGCSHRAVPVSHSWPPCSIHEYPLILVCHGKAMLKGLERKNGGGEWFQCPSFFHSFSWKQVCVLLSKYFCVEDWVCWCFVLLEASHWCQRETLLQWEKTELEQHFQF